MNFLFFINNKKVKAPQKKSCEHLHILVSFVHHKNFVGKLS